MSRRKRMLHDLDQDIRDHIARETQDNIDRGMSPEEARFAALRKFGNVTRAKEDTRAVWSIVWLEQFWQDVRYGLRTFRKNPGFTAVAVLTLALGIGANTAIFSAVNGILLEPLPYADSSRLVRIEREQLGYGLSFAELRDIQQNLPALERIATYDYGSSLIRVSESSERRDITYVSGGLFTMLGVQPLLGRFILPEDARPGNDQVAVLSYRLWMDSFGGEFNVLGRSVEVDGKPHIVIGVMPREFELGVDWGGEKDEGLWMPTVPSLSSRPGDAGIIIVRLKKGATLEEVNAQLQVLSERFAVRFPKGTEGLLFSARRLKRNINPNLQTALLILLGAVGFVLLIACVNLSALLVARAWTRQKELAIRKALGATRPRIVRQLFSESLLFATVGGVLGLLFSVWGVRIIRALAPPDTPRVDRVVMNGSVLWFTLGISILAAILFGLAPAMQISSRRIGILTKDGNSFAGLVSRQSHRFRSALVVLEVALAFILVVGGALMARSFRNLMRIDTGVRAGHVITMWADLGIELARSRENDAADRLRAASENILDGIRSLPGVQQAVLSGDGPFKGGEEIPAEHYPGKPPGVGLYVEGLSGDQNSSGVLARGVTSGFFTTLGIRFQKGRDFGPADFTKSPRVAIVSQSFAAKYIPGDPLGKRFTTREHKDGHHEWMEIIGVVNDVRDRAVEESFSGPAFYTPSEGGCGGCEIIVQTAANPISMVPAIERVIRSVDKFAPITNIETVDQIIARSAAEPKFQTALLGSFGVLGLLLAIIGIYGVISYSVVQRTHEIGVRMALGARPRDVLRLMLGQGARLALIGIIFGLWGAFAVSRFLRSLLFEVKPADPATFAGVAVLFLVVALAACWIPARRAMRVDPLVALRYE